MWLMFSGNSRLQLGMRRRRTRPRETMLWGILKVDSMMLQLHVRNGYTSIVFVNLNFEEIYLMKRVIIVRTPSLSPLLLLFMSYIYLTLLSWSTSWFSFCFSLLGINWTIKRQIDSIGTRKRITDVLRLPCRYWAWSVYHRGEGWQNAIRMDHTDSRRIRAWCIVEITVVWALPGRYLHPAESTMSNWCSRSIIPIGALIAFRRRIGHYVSCSLTACSLAVDIRWPLHSSFIHSFDRSIDRSIVDKGRLRVNSR